MRDDTDVTMEDIGGSDSQNLNSNSPMATIITESPVKLIAPRPMKARRHQKSIISLDNFFTDTNFGSGGGIIGGFGENSSNNSNSSSMLAGYTETTTTATTRDYHNNRGGIYHQQESSRADFSPSAPATASSDASFSDVIPFPSLSPQPSGAGAGSNGERPINSSFRSPRTSLSYHRHHHHHLQPSSITGQMLASSHGRTKSIGTMPGGTRSRKSSLLESWEVQNIRLSGSNMIGETDVAVFMSSADMPDNSNNGGILSGSGGNDGYNPNSSSVEDQAQPQYQQQFYSMPIYSPIPDAVDELFQIMKHTNLSGTAPPVASHSPTSSRNRLNLRVDGEGEDNTNQHYYNSMVPPSPVARTTRNPIILNTEFQDR